MIDVAKTSHLLDSRFIHHATGKNYAVNNDDVEHCYYKGKILGDSASMVSLSTCRGLQGYIRTGKGMPDSTPNPPCAAQIYTMQIAVGQTLMVLFVFV